jgi:hypothetical protein
MGINFKIAIYTGFLAAIFLSVFPLIFKRKNFKEFVENFFMFLIGFTVLGFITTLLIDTQMSSPEILIDTQMSSPKRLKRKEAGHFIHLHNVIMPSNKNS